MTKNVVTLHIYYTEKLKITRKSVKNKYCATTKLKRAFDAIAKVKGQPCQSDILYKGRV